MKVLHVIPSVAPRDGGPSSAVVGMCQALNERGVTAEIVTSDSDGGGRLDVTTGTWQEHGGVRTLFFPRIGSASFKWTPGLASWVEKHCRNYDVVHLHAVFSHSTLAGARACRRHRVPYLVRPLGALASWSLDRHRGRKAVLLAAGLKSAVADAARIHYTSAGEQRDAEARSPWLPAGVVVGLGAADEFFTSDSEQPGNSRLDRELHSDAPFKMVMMSRLDPKKGIDVAIDAAHQLARTIPLGWELVIAGTGEKPYEDRLKDLATRGPASGHIAFVGWVAGAERRALLSSASVSVHASLQENFALSAVEAMAAGVPTVVSPAMDLASDIASAEAGWVVERSADAICATIRALMRDEAGRRRCADNARRFAQAFRWPRVAEQLDTLYRSLATSAARPA